MFKHLRPTPQRFLPLALTLSAALAGATSAQAQTIDGTRDASYPTALALQTNTTGFSNANIGQLGAANGSELDNIHAQIVGSDLFLFLGGNMESNNNHLEIFFDSKSGGQRQLVAGSGAVLDSLAGIKFDTGFGGADYLLSVSVKGTTSGATSTFAALSVYYGVVGSSTASGYAGRGTTAAASTALTLGTSTGAAAINNSNTAGVSDTQVGTPSAVTTGVELRIPLAALGTTAGGGDIHICAVINGAKHDYMSNQALGGFALGQASLGDGTGNYTGGATPVSKVDFSTYTGNQYVTVSNGGALATTAAAGRAQITVAPNPAQGRFQVQLPATTEATSLALYNSLGQAVRQLNAVAGAASATVETSGLAAGVYVLRVQSGAEALATQRVQLN